MKKNIQIGIVATTISFFFIYVIIIALTNPLECVVCRNIILIAFSIYTLLMIGYWVYCVLCLLVCSGADRKVGILFLLSMILFFIILNSVSRHFEKRLWPFFGVRQYLAALFCMNWSRVGMKSPTQRVVGKEVFEKIGPVRLESGGMLGLM